MNGLVNRIAPRMVPDVYPLETLDGCVVYYDMQDTGNLMTDHSFRYDISALNHGDVAGASPVPTERGWARNLSMGGTIIPRVFGDLLYMQTALSFVLWVRQMGVRPENQIFAKVSPNNPTVFQNQLTYHMGDDPAQWHLRWTLKLEGEPDMYYDFHLTHFVNLMDGDWHQLACTYRMMKDFDELDGPGNSRRAMYIDGELAVSVEPSMHNGGKMAIGDMPFILGCDYKPGWIPLTHVRELQIFNRELSANEVRTLYERSR